MKHRCLIIGAGIGGLSAAIALGQRGAAVDVVELKPSEAVLGVGINLPANALRVARELGVLGALLANGFRPEGRRVHDANGVLRHEERWSTLDGLPRAVAVSRPALGEILLAAARDAGAQISYGRTIVAQHASERDVEVSFSDGGEGRYDVILGFDGIRSALRRELFGTAHEPRHSGFGVYRVTAPRPASVRAVNQFIGPRNKAGVIPLSERELYLFLVVAASADWRPDRRELAERLRGELEGYDGLVGELREGLSADSKIVFGAIEEVAVPPPWHRGRAIILGDAAHACAPHLTQGGAQAMEDALVIAQTLLSHARVEHALAAFEGRRWPRVALNQRVSHAILLGEMNHDATHQREWPAAFASLIGEAETLLLSPP